MLSHYDVLGVDPSASAEEISAAYRSLARQFHPDQHPSASVEEQARLTAAMARINDAHHELKDPARRRAYDEMLSGGWDDVGIEFRFPNPAECGLCGSYPSATFTFVHQNAWVLRATRYTIEARLCRWCAQAMGRSKQNRTLVTGWWGYPAVFSNAWWVLQNALNLYRAGRLDEPARFVEVVAPLDDPLPAGKPLFQRGGVYVTAVILGVLMLAGVADSDTGTRADADTGSRYDTQFFGWERGACTQAVGPSVRPVSCAGNYNGKVVDVTYSETACPWTTDYYVEDAGQVFCIATR